MSTSTSFSSSTTTTSRQNSKNSIRCDLCLINLSDEVFYASHLQSARHKKNLKSAKRAVHEKSRKFLGQTSSDSKEVREDDALSQIENPLQFAEFTGLSDYKTKRETYRTRQAKNFEDHYNLYKKSLIAYWSINLTFNPTVEDFKISASDKKWENFGDVVVDIYFKKLPGKNDADTIRCVVQFKQITSHNVKNLESFNNGPFGYEQIAKQIEQIKEIKDKIDDTRFIMFTTSIPDPDLLTSVPVQCCQHCYNITAACKCTDQSEIKQVTLFARTRSNKQNVILNTSEDNDTIFSFICKGKYKIPKIYVYSCQKKARDFPVVIEEIISDNFGENRPNVSKEFVKFIGIWGKGECGGNYKLRKEDVLVRLGQILLEQFRIAPELMDSQEPISKFASWIKALKTSDITLLKSSTNLSPLIQPFNIAIKYLFNEPDQINTTNKTVSFKRTGSNDGVKNLDNPILRGHICEETEKDLENEIPFERIYLIFWKAGLMPLMLQLQNKVDQDYVFNVINELKSAGLTRRYLIKTNQNIVPSLLKMYKFLDFFLNLSNIAKKLGSNILETVQIGATLNLSLIDKCDPLFKRTITPEEFFYMTLGEYTFKLCNVNGENEKYASANKLVLYRELMQALNVELQSKIETNQEQIRNSLVNNNEWLRGVNPNWFS